MQMNIYMRMMLHGRQMQGENQNMNSVMDEQAPPNMNLLMNEEHKNLNFLMEEQAPPNMNMFMNDMDLNVNMGQTLNLNMMGQPIMFDEPNAFAIEEPNPHMTGENFNIEAENNNMTRSENHVLEAVEAFHEDEEGEGEGEYWAEEGESSNRRRKTYIRHSQAQIQEMEKYFKDCPRPDDKQRRMLSLQLGMDLVQVKFWFQNKRTQLKAQQERDENCQLRDENEQLKTDNLRYKNFIKNFLCHKCGGPSNKHGEISTEEEEQRLIAENERIREEVARVSNIASAGRSRNMGTRPNNNCMIQGQSSRMVSEQNQIRAAVVMPGQGGGSSMSRVSINHQQQPPRPQQQTLPGDLIDRDMIWQIAMISMEEIVKMAEMGEPLWIPNRSDCDIGFKLNEEEYFRVFPIGFGPRPGNLYCESSRHSTTLTISSGSLLDVFMSPTHWKSFFSAIVSKVSCLEILSSGMLPGNHNGALQVIFIESHAQTPFVPIRDNIVARYCRQVGEKKWAVVDVSLDIFRSFHLVKSRKRPSGCIIEDMGDGFTKVTWIEHVEAEEASGVHPIYKALVSSGLAFGAKRWLGILQSQTDRLVSVMYSTLPFSDITVAISTESKRSHTRLSERMVGIFNSGVSAAIGHHPWTTIIPYNGPNQIRVLMIRNTDIPGRPVGVILVATYSFWLNAMPITIFQYLQNQQTRSQWDALTSSMQPIEEISRVGIGRDNANSVSVLRLSPDMLVLQEENWDPMGAYIVYAPVDSTVVNLTLVGGDSDFVTMLPTGFVISPDGLGNGSDGAGSLVTLSMQILVDSNLNVVVQQSSVDALTTLLNNTVDSLKLAFMNQEDLFFT
ncbi:homeobox-leucine zipper protein MERISTEM L1-like [Impatiens glandulifera]|uniref:homeobox-leucine zipper protein MERISTEM L1-like n=1 Tax=Impatiens glandulifera TaxID=253017 RepID=UPI001FB11D6D|nr:homeobox-leucine zipper protein MERISTEM L1-like [Impatiens glandulifera]